MENFSDTEENPANHQISLSDNLCHYSIQKYPDQIQSFSHDTIQKDPDSIQKPRFVGVRPDGVAKELPSEVAIERNMMRAPMCVNSPQEGAKNQFQYAYPSREVNGELVTPVFSISNGHNTGLPLPQHAKVLDALLALFANNYNEAGEVWFTFSEISRLLRLNKKNVLMIREAIVRYHHCAFHFEFCWSSSKGRFESRGFLPISYTSLVEEKEKENPKNPRNSRKKKNLHYVKLAPELVASVQSKQIRLFPREAFSELDAGSYSLYKIFYAPTDREPVRRTVFFIANFLGWSNRIDRLRIWTAKHLEVLQEKKFILWWQVKDDCYEVQANPAKYRKDDGFLTAKDPLLAEASYAGRIIETKKRGKLTGEKSVSQTRAAVVSAKESATPKANKLPKAVNPQTLDAATNILGQIANMTQEQLGVLAAFLRAVPEKERSDLLMQRMVLAASMS